MSKLELEAFDKKKGMTLKELTDAIDRFNQIAKINETDTEQSKVTVLINFGGGIKSIVAEV